MSDSDSLSKETTFTPGPWSVGEPHPQNACAYVLGADGDEVATLYGGDQAKKDDDGIWGSQPIRDATANLIAAAPELYEALQRVNDAAYVDENTGEWRLPESFDTGFIDAALRKARGEDRSHEGKSEGAR